MTARLTDSVLNTTQALTHVSQAWDGDIVQRLSDYIAIPAKSPMFDADWLAHGYLETVVRNTAQWIEAQKLDGLTLEVVRLPGRTPVIFFEVAATRSVQAGVSEQTVLMYGHLDKQPEFSGWRKDLGPWTPKYEDGKLYGRGGADDGYAAYAAIAAIAALKDQKVTHPRILGLIETCEESGSYDLLPYVDALRTRLGDVGLVVCLDSGAGNYDQLWLTNSLRGMASGVLRVDVLSEGVHSGDASGVVPSSFRVLRQVLAGWKTAPPGVCCRASSTATCRPSAWRKRVPRQTFWATRSTNASPGRITTAAAPPSRCYPPPMTRCKPCSTAPGCPRSASPAPKVFRP